MNSSSDVSADLEGRLYEAHAALCRTFANPWRLRIVEALGESERSVSELVTLLGASKANVSQHLGLMRDQGILESRRDGVHVYYRLASPKVLVACRLMREVLMERLAQATAMSRLGSTNRPISP